MRGAVRVRGAVSFGVRMRFCAVDRILFARHYRYRRDNRETGDHHDGVADEGRRNRRSRARVG